MDLERVSDAVLFLHAIMPAKPVSELFTVLGRAKQGKTERYRELFRHLQQSDRRLRARARAIKGMVMLVFTLPSFDVVFKVIRDRFAYPKNIVREDVLAKYQLVFKHDRAGRLVDAQEIQAPAMLRFPRHAASSRRAARGAAEQEAAGTVHDRGRRRRRRSTHVYIERRMTPLNLYLREAAPLDARAAVLDYGQAIRDLSATNIFPGDLLLKNFGVTRHGRVIFYDYDELCLVTECNSREMPQPASLEEEMQAEAWFYVGEDDVFQEQFASFLGLEPEHLEIFLEAHSELLTAAYWRDMKEQHLRGEVPKVLPYRPSLTAPPAGGLDRPPPSARARGQMSSTRQTTGLPVALAVEQARGDPVALAFLDFDRDLLGTRTAIATRREADRVLAGDRGGDHHLRFAGGHPEARAVRRRSTWR